MRKILEQWITNINMDIVDLLEGEQFWRPKIYFVDVFMKKMSGCLWE